MAYRIAFFVLLIALLAMRGYFALKVKRAGGRLMPDDKAIAREGGRAFFFFRVTAFWTLVVFLAMYFLGAAWIDAFSFPLPGWLRWTGFGLGVLTLAFWTWTQIHLDTQWSAQLQLAKNHRLVTSGPYAYIRHPLYAGVFAWCIALTLLSANWLFLAAYVISFSGLLWRIPREEQMMLDAFGDEYKAYMQRTGRLFPKF